MNFFERLIPPRIRTCMERRYFLASGGEFRSLPEEIQRRIIDGDMEEAGKVFAEVQRNRRLRGQPPLDMLTVEYIGDLRSWIFERKSQRGSLVDE